MEFPDSVLERIKIPENFAEYVNVVYQDDHTMDAEVSGDGKVHDVHIERTANGYDATCTCPIKTVCKHIAMAIAVMNGTLPIVAVEPETELLSPPTPPTPKEQPSKSGTPPEKRTKTPVAVMDVKGCAPAVIEAVLGPRELVEQQQVLEQIVDLLQEGKDYGTIPGTEKPTLLKPGAERINKAYGCYPRYEVIDREVDHDRPVEYEKVNWVNMPKRPDNWEELKAQGLGRNRKVNGGWVWQEKHTEKGRSIGLYRYVVRCQLVHRMSGAVIGEGVGSCSSMESKYISRPRDLENTILKMAQKRAFVAATLNVYGLSDRFTQDVEDLNS